MQSGLFYEVRSDGSVVLRLDGACIQTTARRTHRALTAALLAGDAPEAGWEAALDLLATFLGTADFAALRAAHPALTGAVACQVRLTRHAAGVRWEVA